MKKVLFVNRNLNRGGAEKQLISWANLLSENCCVSIMLFHKSDSAYRLNENVKIEICTYDGILKKVYFIHKFCRENKIDILISFLPESNLICELASMFQKKWKLIVGARSSNPAFLTNKKLRIYYLMHRFANYVISNSECNKKDILTALPGIESRVKVVYNIIDINDADIKSNTQEHNVNETIKIIIAANYRSVKNLDGLLQALNQLSPKYREKLHIDWYGMKIDDTMTNANEYIQVHNLGSVISLHDSSPEIHKQYEGADVIGLFSHYEGLPNSLCEALVLGKPIICTPVSDMPILLSGTENFICESDSACDIAKALMRVLDTDKRELLNIGANNRSIFGSLFNIQTIKEQLWAVIFE